MNRLVKLLLSMLLLVIIIRPAAAADFVFGGTTVVERTMESVPGGYRDMAFPLMITTGFWRGNSSAVSLEWRYVGPGDGVGSVRFHRLNNRPTLTFSITGAISGEGPGTCEPLPNMRRSMACTIYFPWSEEKSYTVHVVSTLPNTWSAMLRDPDAGTDILIGTLTVPKYFDGATSLSERIESVATTDSGLGLSCRGVPNAVAIFNAPSANSGKVRTSASTVSTSGSCNEPARAFCGSEQICVLSATAMPLESFSGLTNLGNFQCLGTTPGEAARTVPCTGAPALAIREDLTFRFLSGGLCLQSGPLNGVSWGACNDSTAQRWVTWPAFINVASGMCMTARPGALDQPVRMERCDEDSLYQFWY
jgi:hypothetical protein